MTRFSGTDAEHRERTRPTSIRHLSFGEPSCLLVSTYVRARPSCPLRRAPPRDRNHCARYHRARHEVQVRLSSPQEGDPHEQEPPRGPFPQEAGRAAGVRSASVRVGWTGTKRRVTWTTGPARLDPCEERVALPHTQEPAVTVLVRVPVSHKTSRRHESQVHRGSANLNPRHRESKISTLFPTLGVWTPEHSW